MAVTPPQRKTFIFRTWDLLKNSKSDAFKWDKTGKRVIMNTDLYAQEYTDNDGMDWTYIANNFVRHEFLRITNGIHEEFYHKHFQRDHENWLQFITLKKSTTDEATNALGRPPMTKHTGIHNTEESAQSGLKPSTSGLQTVCVNTTAEKKVTTTSRKTSLRKMNPKIIKAIENNIMDCDPAAWDKVKGLEDFKRIIEETIVEPIQCPKLFYGILRPYKAVLLFGPPGTGKSLFAKGIASKICKNFINITYASLASKYVGEGEKNVRDLFEYAKRNQPSVIIFDEIDSLLCEQSNHEASERMKAEFLTQMDGSASSQEDQIFLIGTTNRPEEIATEFIRRFQIKQYIPLPNSEARQQMIIGNLQGRALYLTEEEMNNLCTWTNGYSGSDMLQLCKEAARGPVMDIPKSERKAAHGGQVRPITALDFVNALRIVKASVSPDVLNKYFVWNKKYCSTDKN